MFLPPLAFQYSDCCVILLNCHVTVLHCHVYLIDCYHALFIFFGCSSHEFQFLKFKFYSWMLHNRICDAIVLLAINCLVIYSQPNETGLNSMLESWYATGTSFRQLLRCHDPLVYSSWNMAFFVCGEFFVSFTIMSGSDLLGRGDCWYNKLYFLHWKMGSDVRSSPLPSILS